MRVLGKSIAGFIDSEFATCGHNNCVFVNIVKNVLISVYTAGRVDCSIVL